MLWKVVDENCFYSKNMYNYGNYTIRQEFINNGLWIRYNQLDKLCHHSDPYKELMSQPSQCVLSSLDKVWKSYFQAIKEWKKNQGKFLGMPKLPKYLKKDGRYPWLIKNNSCRIEDGRLKFVIKRLSGVTFPTKAKGRLVAVRFVPKGGNYVLEIITEVDVPEIGEDFESKRIASIDLGVNNFVTMANNIGQRPIIINGRGVKSINQYYNKRKAAVQSDLKRRNDKNWSKKLDDLTFKRNMRIKNFMHNVSRKIVNYCVENDIDTLVLGYNKEWKQECQLSKLTAQKFAYLPYDMLLKQLEYKCQDAGVRFVKTEESYTSGTSFLDEEQPTEANYNKSRRIQRGLFQSNTGRLINSDVNGAYQIMKKVFPNAFVDGIVGCGLTPVVINVTSVT
jgi:putative transposase